MCKNLINLLRKKTSVAMGTGLLIWGLLLSVMATDPFPDAVKPGVFESFNLFVPQLNKSEDDDGRRRFLMLPVG